MQPRSGDPPPPLSLARSLSLCLSVSCVPPSSSQAVAVLYSETSDVWQTTAGTYGSSLRTMYIALKHAQLPVDVLIEEDCLAGRLHYYDVLSVTHFDLFHA